MNQLMPKVTVVLSTWECERWIGRTLASLVHQTYRNFEIILTDDGSVDRTIEVAEKFRPLFEQELIIIAGPHSGLPAVNRNRALKQAAGDLICFLDGDDLYDYQAIETLVKASVKNPGSMIYGMASLFDNTSFSSRYYGFLPLPWKAADSFERLSKGNTVPLSAVMVQRSLLNQVGLFNESPSLQVGEDFDLWLRFAKRTSIKFIPKVIFYYRIHNAGVSKSPDAVIAGLSEVFRIHSINAQNSFKPIRRRKTAFLLRNSLHWLVNCWYRAKPPVPLSISDK